MSKKFEEFGKEFSAITAKHEEAIKRLKDGRDKTDEKLTKAVADRAAVMDELDLDKARELKREIVDLQSDIETYDARIKKAEETRKEELAAFVKRVEADTWAYLNGDGHEEDWAKLRKNAENFKKIIDNMESEITAANDLIRAAYYAGELDMDSFREIPHVLSMSAGNGLINSAYRGIDNALKGWKH